ncbi:ogr/Delta-like zinc finger family protein [Moraxella atlantae]|uniref:ogr/Delta-like zinc finger family protein n=1 Tax=Faucicola atlantae TaxID=34059 RepID=UPI0009A4597E|nr:hypothetical protein B5J92_05925 [Moraxella atlantae]
MPRTTSAYITCPHCHSKMRTHSHRQMTSLLKKIVGTCTNPDCMFVANINVEIVSQIHPSLAPKPEIAAQLTRHKRKARCSQHH